jgi:hypothetical protein
MRHHVFHLSPRSGQEQRPELSSGSYQSFIKATTWERLGLLPCNHKLGVTSALWSSTNRGKELRPARKYDDRTPH